ncbi:MAG: DUF2270 domain-containing protein [Gemmatimonadota bacterium]
MDLRDPPQILVHFYRAAVQHADVWRQRLDATTNWAVVTTAAVITFAFGNRQAPHFVVLVTLVFDFFFLLMETRRYQMYNLWQRRIRTLHRFLIAPVFRTDDESRVLSEEKLAGLAADLGRTVPAIPLLGALGYRIRRNYGPLVTIVLLTWLLKLYIHPQVAAHVPEFVHRAAVGLIPGRWILAAVTIFFTCFAFLAIRAPSEQMSEWRELPAPIDRIPGIKLPGAEKRVTGADVEPECAEEEPAPEQASAPTEEGPGTPGTAGEER